MKGAVQVDGHDLPPLRRGQVGEEHLPGGHPGAAHQSVQGTKELFRLPDQGLGLRPLGYVPGEGGRLYPQGLQISDQGLRLFPGAAVAHRYIPAAPGEPPGGGGPDSPGAPRDEDHRAGHG